MSSIMTSLVGWGLSWFSPQRKSKCPPAQCLPAKWEVVFRPVRQRRFAAAFAAIVVLAGAAEAPASIQFSVAPAADLGGVAPYAGLSAKGAGLTVLPWVPGEPQLGAAGAQFSVGATKTPLGLAWTVGGFTVGLYALDYTPAAGSWPGLRLDTLAIGESSLAMTFAFPQQLHGFGLLILGNGDGRGTQLRMTATEVGGQVSTSVFSRLPQEGGPLWADFFSVDTTAGLRGVVIESGAFVESNDPPVDSNPEPGSVVVWALLGLASGGLWVVRRRRNVGAGKNP